MKCQIGNGTYSVPSTRPFRIATLAKIYEHETPEAIRKWLYDPEQDLERPLKLAKEASDLMKKHFSDDSRPLSSTETLELQSKVSMALRCLCPRGMKPEPQARWVADQVKNEFHEMDLNESALANFIVWLIRVDLNLMKETNSCFEWFLSEQTEAVINLVVLSGRLSEGQRELSLTRIVLTGYFNEKFAETVANFCNINIVSALLRTFREPTPNYLVKALLEAKSPDELAEPMFIPIKCIVLSRTGEAKFRDAGVDYFIDQHASFNPMRELLAGIDYSKSAARHLLFEMHKQSFISINQLYFWCYPKSRAMIFDILVEIRDEKRRRTAVEGILTIEQKLGKTVQDWNFLRESYILAKMMMCAGKIPTLPAIGNIISKIYHEPRRAICVESVLFLNFIQREVLQNRMPRLEKIINRYEWNFEKERGHRIAEIAKYDPTCYYEPLDELIEWFYLWQTEHPGTVHHIVLDYLRP